jgi:protein TonB
VSGGIPREGTMRRAETVSTPPGWTAGIAWRGVGASLLLHLFVGAVIFGTLPGPPEIEPLVIDLTLAEPPGERPGPPVTPELLRSGRKGIPFVASRPDPPPIIAPVVPAVSSLPPPTVPATVSAPVRSEAALDKGVPNEGIGSLNPVPPSLPSFPRGTASGLLPGDTATAGAAPGTGDGKRSSGDSEGNRSGVFSPGDYGRIRDAIQRAIAYPPAARRMGWEGKVVVAFHLLPDGSVRDVRVVQGSGYAALDRGAIGAVRSASPFPRFSTEGEVLTPVVYRLTTR